MPIRKYGTEPAKVETRDEDNDQETLRSVRKQAQEDSGGHKKPERDSDSQDDTA
jgi:hypothetical protein